MSKEFDMGTQLALGFAKEKMEKQEVRSMILEKLGVNPSVQGNESTKEIIKLVFFFKLNQMSLSDSNITVVANLKSLLTNKSLPEDQEDLMFKDDEKSTLQQIVKNMVYR